MSILIDRSKRVIVQGITGREGQARTRLMLDYGTNVVGGVTPGKGGAEVLGLPVFNSCAEAVAALSNDPRHADRGEDGRPHSERGATRDSQGVDVSVLFVPAAGVKDAALDAINAGIKLVVLVADRVPVWDAMVIAKAAKAKGANFVGPNTLGIASPGQPGGARFNSAHRASG